MSSGLEIAHFPEPKAEIPNQEGEKPKKKPLPPYAKEPM
jgi:hypothetical protein